VFGKPAVLVLAFKHWVAGADQTAFDLVDSLQELQTVPLTQARTKLYGLHVL
jgi:hypothetical protein